MVLVMLNQPSYNESDVQVANAKGVFTFSSPRAAKKQTGTRRRRHTNKFNMLSSAATSSSYTEM